MGFLNKLFTTFKSGRRLLRETHTSSASIDAEKPLSQYKFQSLVLEYLDEILQEAKDARKGS